MRINAMLCKKVDSLLISFLFLILCVFILAQCELKFWLLLLFWKNFLDVFCFSSISIHRNTCTHTHTPFVWYEFCFYFILLFFRVIQLSVQRINELISFYSFFIVNHFLISKMNTYKQNGMVLRCQPFLFFSFIIKCFFLFSEDQKMLICIASFECKIRVIKKGSIYDFSRSKIWPRNKFNSFFHSDFCLAIQAN